VAGAVPSPANVAATAPPMSHVQLSQPVHERGSIQRPASANALNTSSKGGAQANEASSSASAGSSPTVGMCPQTPSTAGEPLDPPPSAVLGDTAGSSYAASSARSSLAIPGDEGGRRGMSTLLLKQLAVLPSPPASLLGPGNRRPAEGEVPSTIDYINAPSASLPSTASCGRGLVEAAQLNRLGQERLEEEHRLLAAEKSEDSGKISKQSTKFSRSPPPVFHHNYLRKSGGQNGSQMSPPGGGSHLEDPLSSSRERLVTSSVLHDSLSSERSEKPTKAFEVQDVRTPLSQKEDPLRPTSSAEKPSAILTSAEAKALSDAYARLFSPHRWAEANPDSTTDDHLSSPTKTPASSPSPPVPPAQPMMSMPISTRRTGSAPRTNFVATTRVVGHGAGTRRGSRGASSRREVSRGATSRGGGMLPRRAAGAAT
jgi:hypothetical protein